METTILAAHALIKTALHDAEKVTPSVLRAVVTTLDSLDAHIIAYHDGSLKSPAIDAITPPASPPPRYPLSK
jgi:hypothetical protein